MTKDPYYGVISDTYKEGDYQLAGGVTTLQQAEHSYWENKIQYNQLRVSPVSCTLMAAIGAYSDLTGERVELSTLQELWAEALRRGAKPDWGWYIHEAVDLVRQHFGGLNSFRVEVGSDEFFEAMDKKYSIIGGFRGNALYNQDVKDGILHKIEFGQTTYGHAIRMTKGNNDIYRLTVDNYAGHNDVNTYRIRKKDFKGLIDNNVFFRSGYVFAIKDTIQIKTANVPIWAVKSWTKAVKKGVISEGGSPTETIADHVVEKMLYKSGVFNKKEGNVSRARMVVALDRLGCLD